MRFPVPLLFVSFLVLAGCGGSGDSEPVPLSGDPKLGQEFVLGYGQSVQIEGLYLNFTAVNEDARCPINGACAWEGNARIVLSALRNGQVSVFELNTHSDLRTTAYFAGYVIELRDLHPYPFVPLQIHLPTYKATLVVDGHAVPGG